MGVSVTYFGNQKAVFANQDDGIFSAVPITFDESVLTLETYTANGRKFVKAGSLVKYGTTVKGITAEEYELTDGPVNGRVVLEGYVYVEALTENAVSNLDALPKIVPIPYGKIIFSARTGYGLVAFLKVSGSVWSTSVAKENFTISGATISSVERDVDDLSLLKVTFAEGLDDGETFTITQVATTAVIGATGKVIQGLPLTFKIENGEVCA